MTGSPIHALLGGDGAPVECRVLAPDIAVHWYPTTAQAGDRCYCGKVAVEDDTEDAP